MNDTTKQFILNRLLTTKEVARLTGLSEVAIKKRAERGKLDYVLKGRTYLFDRNDFTREIQRHTTADTQN